MIRYIPAIAYHPQPDGLTVRPRLCVLDRRGTGAIWIGRETPRSRAAARRLAAYLNRRQGHDARA